MQKNEIILMEDPQISLRASHLPVRNKNMTALGLLCRKLAEYSTPDFNEEYLIMLYSVWRSFLVWAL